MSKHLKILLGGSPCTHWSIAQSKNRETTASGIGWELFKNYLYARDKFKPDYFLYENNKSMAKPIRNQIDVEFNRTYAENTNWELISSVEEDKGHTKRWLWINKTTGKTEYITRILINSALVSAQNRQRYYWTNIPNVQQPADRGILLKDILESGMAWTEKGYALTAATEPICLNSKSGRAGVDGLQPSLSDRIYSIDGKATAVTNGFMPKIAEPIRIGTIESDSHTDHDSKQYRVYSPEGKSTTICGQGGGVGAKTGLYACPIKYLWDGKTHPVYTVENGLITIKDKQYPIKLPDGFYIIRKLTVNERRRLQTIPDWYKMPCSASQNHKMLGNGWTIKVIKHNLSYIPGIKDCTVEVLSMYDGMSCGQIALTELGCKIERYVSYEIDKYCIQTTQMNFPKTEQRGDAFQMRNTNWSF
jgi:site-specific DNA-cytosine methylase